MPVQVLLVVSDVGEGIWLLLGPWSLARWLFGPCSVSS